MDREKESGHEAVENEIIEGRNAVIEALRAGRAMWTKRWGISPPGRVSRAWW